MNRYPTVSVRAVMGLLILVLMCDPPVTHAFWRSGHSRRIDQADEWMERGRQAEQEQRILDALDAYTRAHELYQRVSQESPGTRTEHVDRHSSEARARLRTLFARASSGQVPAPSPVEETSAPKPVVVPPPPPPSRPPASTVSATEAPSRPPQPVPAGLSPRQQTDAELSRRIQTMIDKGQGADAVILLEEIVDSSENASLEQRLLFAQALMSRRNYARAETVLQALQDEYPADLAVRMLSSGLAMARGRPVVALRILDDVVREYPRYADAYINLAYTRFAMDPMANRDEAVLYYRHALTLGAGRDPRLELELRVDIVP